MFDFDHIPCAHVIAACRYGNMSCYILCSQYYMKNSLISSYSKSIYPTGNNKDWVIPEDICCRVVLPPKIRWPARKPRKERIHSSGEVKAHDAMVDVVIIGIIEKYANDQSHYILEMNIVVSILLTTISTSKNSPYN